MSRIRSEQAVRRRTSERRGPTTRWSRRASIRVNVSPPRAAQREALGLTIGSMPPQVPKALVFDLGGVLLDIDFDRAFRAWSTFSALSLNALKQKFHFDEQYQRHERGEIESDDYFTHITSLLSLSASIDEVATGWNSIFVGEVSETLKLVEYARRSLPCYVLTNTNATHMARWTGLFPNVTATVDRVFASHHIGRRKPEKAAFDHVCLAVGLTPQSLLFFDDSPENVSGASDAGLQSVLVRGPADVARSFAELGL